MSAFDDVKDHVLERFKLAGRQACRAEPGHIHLEQPRVAADLAELEQRIEDGHLTLGHALAFHIGKHLLAELARQGGVQLDLLVGHGAVGDVFHLGRQILGHFDLGAAQNERLDPRTQVFERFAVSVANGFDDAALEGMLRAKKARHQKLEQRPQLEQVVFNGRTRKAQAHARLDGPHRTRGDRIRVFDVLRFVKDDGVEEMLFEFLQIPAQQRIGGDDELGPGHFAEHSLAPGAIDDQALEIRHKFLGFAFPVGQY